MQELEELLAMVEMYIGSELMLLRVLLSGVQTPSSVW